MLWIKSLHLIFVMSWFAGLFYLPRIMVNLALERDPAVTARLLIMGRKLYRFMTLLAIPAIVLGFGLWMVYGIGKGPGPGNGWMHAKLGLIILVIGYHHACGSLLKKFETGNNKRSHVWFRWFNEVPVLLLSLIVVLVVVKPF